MWGREAYSHWAPPEALWSLWAKPTLFAQKRAEPKPGMADVSRPAAADPKSPLGQFLLVTQAMFPTTASPFQEEQLASIPPADGKTAVIAELPGVTSVQLALQLAKRGWRPVPLFNATHARQAEVPLDVLMNVMEDTTDELARLRVQAGAPPVFLLDAGRQGPRKSPPPGAFDNRWMVFPQDFPSAARLRSHGIEQVLILVQGTTTLADDLSHVLLRWQEGGVKILHDNLDTPAPPQPFEVPKPKRFRHLFYVALAGFGLYRNSAGGFGGRVPTPGSGGG